MPIITLRVTEQDHALWVRQAGSEGISLSEWIRRRCDTSREYLGTQGGKDPSPPSLNPKPTVPAREKLGTTGPGLPFRTDFKKVKGKK